MRFMTPNQVIGRAEFRLDQCMHAVGCHGELSADDPQLVPERADRSSLVALKIVGGSGMPFSVQAAATQSPSSSS